MTTESAARQYEKEHLLKYAGCPLAIFNPQDKPIDELPVIYGFNDGGEPGFMAAYLIAEDGECLGSHLCSSEAYMPHDLGCLDGSRPDRHETFKEHYPDGYRMEFVPYNDIVRGHVGLRAALDKNAALELRSIEASMRGGDGQ